MTLSAHAIVGAGIAAAMPAHPLLGITLAFGSHFLVDAVPHRDYRVRSLSLHPDFGHPFGFNKDLLLDLATIGLDLAFGLTLAIVLFATIASPSLILIAAFVGTLPDAVHLLDPRWKHEPVITFQKIHRAIQNEPALLEDRPFLGIFLQIVFVSVIVIFLKTIAL